MVALKKIGKPASIAAVKAIGRLRIDEGEKGKESLERLALLVFVIVKVEGPDVAKFLITRELGKVTGPAKAAYEKALEQVKAVASALGVAPEGVHRSRTGQND